MTVSDQNSGEDKSSNARRERRIQRKREEIINAATSVIARKGVAATTTKDIAEEADMGESTLYNYFESKRDILLAIMQQQQSLYDNILHESITVTNRESLIEMMDRIMEVIIERTPFLRAMMIEAWIDDEIMYNFVLVRINEIVKLVQQFITAQIHSGMFRPMEPTVIIRCIVGTFAAYMLPILRGIQPVPSPAERHKMAETAMNLILDGVGAKD
jgi:AcrR family transcriptional regulator